MNLKDLKARSLAVEAPKLERLPEVIHRTGMSRSGIYRLISSGHFPSPVKLSQRSVAWPAAKVSEWINSRETTRAGN